MKHLPRRQAGKINEMRNKNILLMLGVLGIILGILSAVFSWAYLIWIAIFVFLVIKIYNYLRDEKRINFEKPNDIYSLNKKIIAWLGLITSAFLVVFSIIFSFVSWFGISWNSSQYSAYPYWLSLGKFTLPILTILFSAIILIRELSSFIQDRFYNKKFIYFFSVVILICVLWLSFNVSRGIF